MRLDPSKTWTSVLDRAAQPVVEVVLCPGLHAIWGHGMTHRLWLAQGYSSDAGVSRLCAHFLTGVEIHPGATIGPSFFIDHGMGVVIGATAEIGTDVTLYHGVTLGGTSLCKKANGIRRSVIGSWSGRCKVLGPIEIGAESRIGANAVVVSRCRRAQWSWVYPATSPAEVTGKRRTTVPDLEHARLPDTQASQSVPLAHASKRSNDVTAHRSTTSAWSGPKGSCGAPMTSRSSGARGDPTVHRRSHTLGSEQRSAFDQSRIAPTRIQRNIPLGVSG